MRRRLFINKAVVMIIEITIFYVRMYNNYHALNNR